MLTRLAVALTLCAACGGGAAVRESGSPCAGGELSADREVAALAGCREVGGDLALGGAVTDLAPLAGLEEVAGSLRIGPTLELSSASLTALRRVGGDFEVRNNPFASGLYLAALEEVGGDLRVSRNLSATTVALPRLRAIGGALTVAESRMLRRLDLAALTHVGGDVRASGLPALETVLLPARVEVGGAVHIAGDSSAPAGWRSLDPRVKGTARALQPGAALR